MAAPALLALLAAFTAVRAWELLGHPLFGTELLGAWIYGRWQAFGALKPETQISALQLVALVVGGLWAFGLYRRRREGQATVRVTAATRVYERPGDGLKLLLVRVHISNESAVVVGEIRATVTLLMEIPDAVGDLRLRREGTRDALLSVNGELIEQQDGTVLFEPWSASLEPGACVESEGTFPPSRRCRACRHPLRGYRGSAHPLPAP